MDDPNPASTTRYLPEPGEHVVDALAFLLMSIGSWTPARFDQHLRYEFGDDVAEEVLAWLTPLFTDAIQGISSQSAHDPIWAWREKSRPSPKDPT